MLQMLWYKAWLDTRWRFLITAGLLMCSAGAVVLVYPRVMALMPLVPPPGTGGEIGQRIAEAADLSRDYRGYIWSQWLRQNALQLGTLTAALLGAGGVVSSGSGGAPFLLSLPVSRTRLLGVRAAAGLTEWLAAALASCLALAVLSPAVGEHYPIGDAVIHGVCLFAAGTVFFSLAVLMSTIFTDPYRPLLIAVFTAMALGVAEQPVRSALHIGIFSVMSGEAYFRGAEVPWGGLVVSGALSGALLFTAAMNFARRDF